MTTKSEPIFPLFQFQDQIYRIRCEAIHLSKGFDFMSFQQLRKENILRATESLGLLICLLHIFRHIYRQNEEIGVFGFVFVFSFKLHVNLPFSPYHFGINTIIKPSQAEAEPLVQSNDSNNNGSAYPTYAELFNFTECFPIPLPHSCNYELAMRAFVFSGQQESLSAGHENLSQLSQH